VQTEDCIKVLVDLDWGKLRLECGLSIQHGCLDEALAVGVFCLEDDAVSWDLRIVLDFKDVADLNLVKAHISEFKLRRFGGGT
jgi:hypothetical protein